MTDSRKNPVADVRVIGGVLLALVAVVGIALVIRSNQSDSVVSADAPSEIAEDDFKRDDSTDALGAASTGQPWTAVKGIWGIKDGAAVLASGNPDGPRNYAWVELGANAVSVSAEMGEPCQGWGLVFRYVGPNNYWLLNTSPEFAAISVAKMVNGTPVSVTKFSPVRIQNGSTVGVEYRDAIITVVLDNQPIGSISDSHAIEGTKAGVLGGPECVETGRWNEFRAVNLPDDRPVVIAPLRVAPTTPDSQPDEPDEPDPIETPGR